MDLKYRRALLKLSGEALLGELSCGIDPKILGGLAEQIVALSKQGAELAIVIGGGNIFRGAGLAEAGMNRVTGDHMGMLATVMNALAMADALRQRGVAAEVQSAFPMTGVCETYSRDRAVALLNQGTVVLCAAGTGNPFFTTDSAASLRAAELQVDLLIKATKVDGVYSADPVKEPNAVLYHELSYAQVLAQDLRVMDATAFVLCRDHKIPLRVANINHDDVLQRLLAGEDIGTLVSAGEKP